MQASSVTNNTPAHLLPSLTLPTVILPHAPPISLIHVPPLPTSDLFPLPPRSPPVLSLEPANYSLWGPFSNFHLPSTLPLLSWPSPSLRCGQRAAGNCLPRQMRNNNTRHGMLQTEARYISPGFIIAGAALHRPHMCSRMAFSLSSLSLSETFAT